MANTRISDLQDTGVFQDNTVVPVVTDIAGSPDNARVSGSTMKTYMFSGKGDTGDLVTWQADGTPGEGAPANKLVDTGTAQTLTGKTISAKLNTLQHVVDTGSPQTVTDKTVAFKNNTLTGVVDTGSFLGAHTIWIPAAAMEVAASTAPATSNVVEIGTSLFAARTIDFATDADDFAYASVLFPNSWDETSNLSAQFVWSATDTGAIGAAVGVAWGCAAIAHVNSDALTEAFPAPAIVRDNHSGTNDDLATSPNVSVDVGGDTGANPLVLFEFSRDVSDTGDDLPVDARLHGVRVRYTINEGVDV